MRLILAFTLLSLGIARHIAGADLYYRCVNPAQGTYEFELWLYRDCTDPQGADYDNPIVLYVFRGDGSLETTQNIYLTSSGPWNPQGVDACFVQRPGTCLEEGVYRFRLTLPPRSDGYYVAWARCCRNATITNLANPLYMGITYLAQIPPVRRAACNSSPRFVQRPPFFLCANTHFYFDHRAIDADGDSLVYEVVAAYHSVNTQGQGAFHPDLGGSPTVGPHNPMGPPPYTTVAYAPGYSPTQPFGGGGICAIDPVTGLLHLYAPNPGLYVVAIAVREYRNGLLLGETRRDMQFYVAPCRPPTGPPVVTSDLSGTTHRGDTLILTGTSPNCITVTIRDTQPPTLPAVLSYRVDSLPVSISASGSNPLFLEVCINPACKDSGRIVPLVITGRKTEICGTTEARDTLWVQILASPPTYPLALYTPDWSPENPLVAVHHYQYCFKVIARDTGRNGGIYALAVFSPRLPVTLSSLFQRGDSVEGEVCLNVDCSFSPDSLYPLIVWAINTPECVTVPPATIDTLWVRPRSLPISRPPHIQRDRPSPWQVIPSTDSICYTLLISDPDSFSLLSYEGRGGPFSPDFYYGSHFTITASGDNPLTLRLCAQINCYAQGTRFPVVICVRDTTSCEPVQRWEVCDTLWIETDLCYGTVPNVFTPNGDGVNDRFLPTNLSGVSRWRLQVWDRWGRPTFRGDWNIPWEGETPMGPAPEGVYFYLVEMELFSGQGPPLRFQRAGSVSLLR